MRSFVGHVLNGLLVVFLFVALALMTVFGAGEFLSASGFGAVGWAVYVGFTVTVGIATLAVIGERLAP